MHDSGSSRKKPIQEMEAMRRHIDPEKITISMAGDFAQGAIPDRE